MPAASGSKTRVFFRETLRSALLGALGGYVFLAYFYLSTWVSAGTPLGWNPIVNDFWGVVRNLSAALFFYPAVGLVVNLVAGALTASVTGLVGLDEDGRRRVGVIVVGVVAFAVLGLPVSWERDHLQCVFTVGYVVKLAMGAGFVYAALRLPGLVGGISRWAGRLLAASAVLWFAFCFVFPSTFPPPDPDDRPPPGPNVVVLLADAHRADVSSLYGGEVPTPNLERLAARGVTFDRCFAPSSWTFPSVVALFTGLAPEVSGMDSVRAIPPRLSYLPEQLSRRGYRTWCMMANPLLTPELGFSRGFDHYGLHTYEFYGQGFLEYARSFYNTAAFALNKLLGELDYERLTDLGFDASLDMLRSLTPRGGDFVYLHLYDPHAPYRPPERLVPEDGYEGPYAESSGDFLNHREELSDEDVARLKQLYEAEVRLVDEFLGRALDVLDEQDLWGNTVFVFLADHGDEFREHGLIEHFQVNLQHELTHVPLVVYWPGRLGGGGRFARPVGLADVYATLSDGLGVACDETMLNGRSLIAPSFEDRPVFAQRCMDERDEHVHSDFVVRDEAALFVNYSDGVEELYLDYYADPTNVIGEHPELAEELRGLLGEWHERNAALIEHYGTGGGGPVEPADLERLRAVGYIQ
jgi:arylsulfatase A-like enzyme